MREQPRARYRWWPWAWQASVLIGCALIALAYFAAIARARAPWATWRSASLVAGLLVVIVALNGPVHDLSELYLFTAHMGQHTLLSEVFPPLLLLGLPAWMASAIFRGRRAAVWRVLTALVKILIASGIMAAVAWGLEHELAIRWAGSEPWRRGIRVSLAIGAGLATLALTARALRLHEFQVAFDGVWRRVAGRLSRARR